MTSSEWSKAKWEGYGEGYLVAMKEFDPEVSS